MAVIWCREIMEGRTGSRDERGYRTYQRAWQVAVDDPADGPLAATDTGNLPLYYSPYVAGNDSDPWAVVVGYDVQPWSATDAHTVWKVTVKYSSAPIDFGNSGATTASQTPTTPSSPSSSGGEEQPELRPWLISFTSRQSEVPLAIDLADEPVVNKAGVPFDPPVTVPRSTLVMQIQAWSSAQLGTLYAKAVQYLDSVNSDPWMGFAAKTLRCVKYDVGSQWERGAYTRTLNIELEIKRNKWNPVKVLNAGLVQIVSMSKPLEPCKDSTGQPVSQPVPLDNSGKQLPPGGTPIYLEFQGYDEQPFGGLVV